MSWIEPGRGGFDPEKHARRKEEKARQQERLAEQQRLEQERLAAQEAERAARVEQSLSQDVRKHPTPPPPQQSQQPQQTYAQHGAPMPQAGPDSYRLKRTGVGCWGFIGLYFLFFMLFSLGSAALTLVDGGLGTLASIGVPILAYFMWRNFYRQYRGGRGFLIVGGGLLVVGFLLMLMITPFAGP